MCIMYSRISLVLITTILFISGCSPKVNPIMAVGKVVTTSNAKVAVLGSQIYHYDINVIYRLLGETIERNGRHIENSSAETHTVVVSYPFSMLRDRWGGTLTVHCEPVEYGTKVTITGGPDPPFKITNIANEIFSNLSSKVVNEEPIQISRHSNSLKPQDAKNRRDLEIMLEKLSKKLEQAVEQERWEDAKNIQALIQEMKSSE